MRNSSFVLALRYCRRSKLVFTSFCFQTVPKPELTWAARIMDRNSEKWSQKGYHSLHIPFLTACRNTAAYCIIFLTVWNSRLRQQISKKPSLYKVSLSFRWKDEGKQAVKTKAEGFKAWRLFLLSSLFLSNMHYWSSVRSISLDIWPNSFFCILLYFLAVLSFFLVGSATRLRRSFSRCATSSIKARLRSLLRTY